MNAPPPLRQGYAPDTSAIELERQRKMMEDARGPNYQHQLRARQPQSKQHHHQFTDVTFRTIRPPPELQRMTQQEIVQALASELPSTRTTETARKLPPAQVQSPQHTQRSQQQQRPRISFGGEHTLGKQARKNRRRGIAKQQPDYFKGTPRVHTRG